MPVSPASALLPRSRDLGLLLVRPIKEQLVGRSVLDEQDLKKEIMAILTNLSDDEKSRAFDHWMERCEWVKKMQVSIIVMKAFCMIWFGNLVREKVNAKHLLDTLYISCLF
jgi:hypothetical protein